MDNEPNYYQILGLQPTADAAAIEAAYQGRSLRFRVGQLRHRARELSGPSQEQIEQAYAVLGNPQSRARYDAAYFPELQAPQATSRRRFPAWVWLFAGVWVLAICVIVTIGLRGRFRSDGGAIGRIVGTVTVTAATSPAPSAIAAALSPTRTLTVVPTPSSSSAPVATATAAAALPPTSSATIVPTPRNTSTMTSVPPTATLPLAPPTATLAPTRIPPTATALPTTVPPTPVPTPVPPTQPPPPPPAPPPAFPATDRIGAPLQVNLRSGPSTLFPVITTLAPGTLLAATGETASTSGVLWRRFTVEGGAVGWVRDLDVLPVR